ncbi:MAG: glpG protein [Pirellulaceae bacterium]|nr:MAG: glpG protein [Pirellulaceae bacterium]
MRSLGNVDNQDAAEKLVAYLLTEGISTQVETTEESEQIEIWVRDEDQLPTARQIYDEFRHHPSDPKYAAAVSRARRLLKEQQKQREKAASNVRRMQHRSAPGPVLGRQQTTPVTILLLVVSLAVFVLTNFGEGGPPDSLAAKLIDGLRFVSLSDYEAAQGNPAASLLRGEVWRAVTPIFLHWSLFHLAMNMFMLWSFGRLMERMLGTPTFAGMVLLMAVFPNLLQGLAPSWLHGSPMFGGMSGVLFGLFGYVWIRSKLDPWFGVRIPFPFVVLLVGMLVGGLLGMFPGLQLAHLCHLGGLIIGMAWAVLSVRSS